MPLSDRPPLISVIVAVYNVADHILAAIDSLKSQSFTAFEALIVDDGSTDASADLVRAAIAGDPRFELIQQENRGLSGARNTGLDRARGDCIAFLDGDDAFAPEFLETLHAQLQATGALWAASGLWLCYPDGQEIAHSARHGDDEPGDPRVLPLQDARDVAQLFPSAWNKLYRRAVIGDLRFVEGSWFEDHEFFWAMAARAPAIAYTPAPLYRHRRDRAGQITGTDSDRVFEQFDVLRRLQPLVHAQEFSHSKPAFERLCTRLIDERAAVVANVARRARYLTTARAFMAEMSVQFTPADDPHISRGFALSLKGELPLSVVVIAPYAAALTALPPLCEALSAQAMADFEVVVVAPEGGAVPAQLPNGVPLQRVSRDGLTWTQLLARLRGRYVAILPPGELPLTDGFLRLVNAAEWTGRAMTRGGLEPVPGGYHDGWTDNNAAGCDLSELALIGGTVALPPAAALRLFPTLGNTLMRRDALEQVLGGQPVVAQKWGALESQTLLLTLALSQREMAFTRFAVMRQNSAPAQMAAVQAKAALKAFAPPGAEDLPPGWRGVVWLRLIRPAGIWSWMRATLGLCQAGWLRVSRDAQPDPSAPKGFRAFVRAISWAKR